MSFYAPSYTGPEKVKYLFIDGGCLDLLLETLSNGLFGGSQIEIDYRKLANSYQKFSTMIVYLLKSQKRVNQITRIGLNLKSSISITWSH